MMFWLMVLRRPVSGVKRIFFLVCDIIYSHSLKFMLLFDAVKAGGKFQPKAKPRPVKKGPAVAASTVSLTSKPTGDTVATDSFEALKKDGKNSQNC